MSPEHQFVAYELHSGHGVELVPAAPSRGWMNSTAGRFANRCLPLLMANQAGWLILNAATVRARWHGGDGPDSVEIDYDSQLWFRPTSHFGHGVITWNIPFLFRTPPGFNLLVRGPANQPKHGIACLEGIVETDWTPATFTINWKFTRRRVWATFKAGEPLCFLVPQRRGELEQFIPRVVSISEAPADLLADYHAWREHRSDFNEDLKRADSPAARAGWQKDYFRGALPDGSATPEHQTRMHLRPFT
jgi:uncharacterized protein DUF6065